MQTTLLESCGTEKVELGHVASNGKVQDLVITQYVDRSTSPSRVRVALISRDVPVNATDPGETLFISSIIQTDTGQVVTLALTFYTHTQSTPNRHLTFRKMEDRNTLHRIQCVAQSVGKGELWQNLENHAYDLDSFSAAISVVINTLDGRYQPDPNVPDSIDPYQITVVTATWVNSTVGSLSFSFTAPNSYTEVVWYQSLMRKRDILSSNTRVRLVPGTLVVEPSVPLPTDPVSPPSGAKKAPVEWLAVGVGMIVFTVFLFLLLCWYARRGVPCFCCAGHHQQKKQKAADEADPGNTAPHTHLPVYTHTQDETSRSGSSGPPTIAPKKGGKGGRPPPQLVPGPGYECTTDCTEMSTNFLSPSGAPSTVAGAKAPLPLREGGERTAASGKTANTVTSHTAETTSCDASRDERTQDESNDEASSEDYPQ